MDGLIYQVEGKIISKSSHVEIYKTEKIDIGGSKEESSETPAEETGSSSDSASVINVVDSNRLQPSTGWDKTSFTGAIKSYMKRLKEHLEKSDKAAADQFVKGAPAVVKRILQNFADFDFYTGNSQDPDGMVILCHYKDGKIPIFWFWRHGLEEEKVLAIENKGESYTCRTSPAGTQKMLRKHFVKTTNVPTYANRADLSRWLKKKGAPLPAAMYLWRDTEDHVSATPSSAWFLEYHKNYDVTLLLTKIKQKEGEKDPSVIDPFEYASVIPMHSFSEQIKKSFTYRGLFPVASTHHSEFEHLVEVSNIPENCRPGYLMQSFFSVSSMRIVDVHINKEKRKAIIRFPSEENASLATLMKHNTILGVDTISIEKLD